MKLLHVVPTYFPALRYGGPIVSVHGLCRALAARGHDVDVFTTNVDGEDTLDVPVATPVDVEGVHVSYFPSTMRRLYLSPQMSRALREQIGNYDLVHIHAVYLWPGVAAARAARKHGIPYVISPRGMLVPELIRRKNSTVKVLWLQLLERRGFAHANAIHFTSQLEWDEARRIRLPLPSPFIVPNGVDIPPLMDIARDDRTLVFVGRINWKKGLDRVIEALPRLPGVRFVIRGIDDENLTPRLIELAAKAGVADRVEIGGPIYGEAKNRLLAQSTLSVLLSSSENFGNAVLEALAMGTPVVLSRDVGLAGDVLNAGAGLVGIEGIPELLNDPERRERMGQNGRAMVESKFAWPKVAEEMEEAYRCSIRSRR